MYTVLYTNVSWSTFSLENVRNELVVDFHEFFVNFLVLLTVPAQNKGSGLARAGLLRFKYAHYSHRNPDPGCYKCPTMSSKKGRKPEIGQNSSGGGQFLCYLPCCHTKIL